MRIIRATSPDGTIIFANEKDEISGIPSNGECYKGIDESGSIRRFSRLSRVDGPARIEPDGSRKWFFDGHDITEEAESFFGLGGQPLFQSTDYTVSCENDLRLWKINLIGIGFEENLDS